MLYHPKQKPWRGGGHQTDKHLTPRPFTGQEKHSGLEFISYLVHESKYTCLCIPGREPADVAEEAGLEESVAAAVHHVHHQNCREQSLLPLVCRQT